MTDRDRASTFGKGLAVLSCFEGGARDLTMADVAERCGFDRAVARRLCLTLEAEGYLRRDGRFLRLTPRVLGLAGGFLAAEGIGRSVQPVLNQCAEDMAGEVALAVLDGSRARYVARSAVGAARLSIGFSVGSALPLHATAVGHMLLAGCAEPGAVLPGALERFTDRTETRRAPVLAQVEEARAQGFAYLSGAFEAGAAGLAVPAPALSGAVAVLATSDAAATLADAARRGAVLDALFRAAHALRS